MHDLLDMLHRAGVGRDLTAELEQQISSLEGATGARPRMPTNPIGGALSMLWVDTCELSAKSVSGYGPLGERERRFLDDQAASLERSVRELEQAIDSSSGAPARTEK